MNEKVPTASELRRTLSAALLLLLTTAVMVTVCYYFVDRPVAIWAVTDNWSQLSVVKYITKLPAVVLMLAPIAVLWGVIIRGWRQWYFGERLAFAIGCGVVVATVVKNDLAIVFGRAWPATWHHRNPSLLHDGVYGFHPFSWATAFHAFPSGHTMVTALVVVTVASVYPALKYYCWGLAVLIGLSLVLKNHHFVGDVVAGGSLGMIAGWLTLSWFSLTDNKVTKQN